MGVSPRVLLLDEHRSGFTTANEVLAELHAVWTNGRSIGPTSSAFEDFLKGGDFPLRLRVVLPTLLEENDCSCCARFRRHLIPPFFTRAPGWT